MNTSDLTGHKKTHIEFSGGQTNRRKVHYDALSEIGKGNRIIGSAMISTHLKSPYAWEGMVLPCISALVSNMIIPQYL
jgi:hypothetical protein